MAWLRSKDGAVPGEPARVLVDASASDSIATPGGWTDVPADGTSLGEIALRGNNVMLGYYRDPEGDGRGRRRRMAGARVRLWYATIVAEPGR